MDIKWSKTMFFICGIDYLSKYKLWMYFLNIFFLDWSWRREENIGKREKGMFGEF